MKRFLTLCLVLMISLFSVIPCYAASTYSYGTSQESVGGIISYESNGTEHTIYAKAYEGSYYKYFVTLYLYEDDDYIYLMVHTADQVSTKYKPGFFIDGSNQGVSATIDDFYVHKLTKNTYAYGFEWTSIYDLQQKALEYIDKYPDSNQFGVYVCDSTVFNESTKLNFFTANLSDGEGGNTGGESAPDGFFDSVLNWFATLVDSIKNLSENMWTKFKDAILAIYESIVGDGTEENPGVIGYLIDLPGKIWEKFTDVLGDIKLAIVGDGTEENPGIIGHLLRLPGKIIDGIKEIFIPDTEEIDVILDDLVSEVEGKFGFNSFNMDNLFSKSSAPENVIGQYNIYGKTYTLTFADFSFLATGVEFFRPYVRGFLVLLLFLFNVRMAFGTFDLDSGISAGQVASMAKSADKGDK